MNSDRHNKKLNEFSPKEVLLTTDGIENIAKKYDEKKERKLQQGVDIGILVAALVNLIFNIISVATSFNQMRLWNKIVTIILIVAIFIYLIVYVIKVIKNRLKIKKEGELQTLNEMLLERVREDMKYTAIIRIVYKENDKLYYLIDDKSFLPHCYMDREKTIDEQKDSILTNLSSKFNLLSKDVLNVKPVDGLVHFSIKTLENELKMNVFVFYDITIKEQEKEKLLKQGKWVTVETMKEDAEALATNQDVINLLDKLPSPIDSFEKASGDIRIIWNITSQCSYNCAICATYDPKRQELSPVDKLKALHSIYTAKDCIKDIDFAGGDPLTSKSEEIVDIIRTAIIMFGEDSISLTTTGAGASASTFSKLNKKVKHYEITIDAAHNGDLNCASTDRLNISRNADEYCDNNIQKINTLLLDAEGLTINVPIINDDLDENEIDSLIRKILDIKNRHPHVKIDVTLLRLMPVGKMAEKATKTDYETYNPIPVIKSIKAKLENSNIKCKLHCSLRLLPEFDNDSYCTMLEKKLGIDCAGNVFACAWGGYVSGPIEENPFYLGNLLQNSLSDIIKGNLNKSQYANIKAEMNVERKYCSVVSYYLQNNAFQNNDPLAKSPTR